MVTTNGNKLKSWFKVSYSVESEGITGSRLKRNSKIIKRNLKCTVSQLREVKIRVRRSLFCVPVKRWIAANSTKTFESGLTDSKINSITITHLTCHQGMDYCFKVLLCKIRLEFASEWRKLDLTSVLMYSLCVWILTSLIESSLLSDTKNEYDIHDTFKKKYN